MDSEICARAPGWPRGRGRRLATAVGCGLGGLGTAGLLTSLAWAGEVVAVGHWSPGAGAAAIGIGPAFHTRTPPLVHFSPAALCSQRTRLAVGVRSRRGERVTLLSLALGRRPLRLGRHRRAPVRIVLRHLPRRAFRLRLRLRVEVGGRTRSATVVRRYGPCAHKPVRRHRLPDDPPQA